ncbi:MAG: inositol monophosphatase [Alphaproteobacteria bacterium]|nr:inositol monophosphatase [Alphaproteobacteria bacterium]
MSAADQAWIVDPIDGTGNFAAGIPFFTSIVALVAKGETVGAWIYDPIRDSIGWAIKGEGGWLDGIRSKVSSRRSVASMAGGLHLQFAPSELASALARNVRRVGSVFEPRGAGHEYLYLAAGKVDFTLFHRLLPWDHAAGLLLHHEAGGYACRFDGSAYRPIDDPWLGSILVALDRPTWESLRLTLLAPLDESGSR